jgi:hypothetical protein
MAMATIMTKLDGKSAKDAIAFMQQELREPGEHHLGEVQGAMLVQLSIKAATAKFGEIRKTTACMAEMK